MSRERAATSGFWSRPADPRRPPSPPATSALSTSLRTDGAPPPPAAAAAAEPLQSRRSLALNVLLPLLLTSALVATQLLLIVWGYSVPLLTSSTAYHPSIGPIVHGDSESTYVVAGAGTTQLLAFQYIDRFPVLNTTRTSSPNGSLVSSRDGSICTATSLSFACSYTVYANVTVLSRQ